MTRQILLLVAGSILLIMGALGAFGPWGLAALAGVGVVTFALLWETDE